MVKLGLVTETVDAGAVGFLLLVAGCPDDRISTAGFRFKDREWPLQRREERACRRRRRPPPILLSQKFWWMFTGRSQNSPEVHQRCPVQSQCLDGGTAQRRQTHDQPGVLTPGKVRFPRLLSWMEQRKQLTCGWVGDQRSVALVPIAAPASKSQIVQSGRTTGGQRNDVFDAKRTCGELIARPAVLAEMARALGHQAPQRRAHPRLRHIRVSSTRAT